jgi:hypothetical protein
MEALVDVSSVLINCSILSTLIFCSKKRSSVKVLAWKCTKYGGYFERERRKERNTQITSAAVRWPERLVLLILSNIN